MGARSITDPSGLVLTGVSASDYTLTGATGSVTIGIVGSSVTVTAATTVPYDGNTHGATATWSTTGSDSDGGSLTVTYYAASDLGDPLSGAPTDAGSYVAKASFVTDGNHTASSNTADFSITPATLTVNIPDQVVTYNTSDNTLPISGTTVGGVGSETFAVTYASTGLTGGTDVWIYPITASVAENGNGSLGNYNVVYAGTGEGSTTGTLTVGQVGLTITLNQAGETETTGSMGSPSVSTTYAASNWATVTETTPGSGAVVDFTADSTNLLVAWSTNSVNSSYGLTPTGNPGEYTVGPTGSCASSWPSSRARRPGTTW